MGARVRIDVRCNRGAVIALFGPALVVGAGCGGSGEVTRADGIGVSTPTPVDPSPAPDASDDSNADGVNTSAPPSASAPATASVSPSSSAPACASPDEGCPCAVPGQTSTCRGPPVSNGSYVYCLVGYRACDGRSWGPCILPTIYGGDAGG